MSNKLASLSCSTLLNGTPTPLALLSDAGEVIACNPAWERHCGPPGPLLARVHDDDRDALSAQITAQHPAASDVSTTARVIDARGKAVPLRWRLWRADATAVWAAVEPDRDAWEAKARILVDVFQTMDAVIWWSDRRGVLHVSDGNGLKHVGLTPGQIVGMNVYELYSADAQVLELCKRVLNGETIRMETASEHAHWAVFYAPRRGEDGEIEGVQTFGINLTQNFSLAVQAELLRACIDSMPIVVWAFDRAGKCTVAQGGGLAHLGLTEPSEKGKHFIDLCGDTREVREAFRRALAGEVMSVEDIRHDGIWRTRFVPQKDVLGEVISIGAISEDVSQQRDVEQQLREQLRLTREQQESIARLSSPIIEVWDDVLIVPLIGAVDADRAAMVMESLLARVVEKQASYAILDLTGIEAVDTMTAQHMIRIIDGLKLLGCKGVVTGIRPSVAQTIVGLGFDLSQIRTLRSLKEALRWCMSAARR